MKIREAISSDVQMLFDWANNGDVRKHAFSPEPLIWESHKQWFEQKLIDTNSHIYIALLDDAEAVGQIRFDVTNSTIAKVDVHTKPSLRYKGVGSQLIALGSQRFLQQTAINEVHAIVKQENTRSRRAFEKAGFTLIGEVIVQRHACYRLCLTRKLATSERKMP